MPTQYLDDQEELLEAVKASREDRVRALLSCGTCHVDFVDKEGRTPLHWACQYGHLSMVCLLLAHYSSSKASAPSYSSQTRNDGSGQRNVCLVCQQRATSNPTSLDDGDNTVRRYSNSIVINLQSHARDDDINRNFDVINSNADVIRNSTNDDDISVPVNSGSGHSIICDGNVVTDRTSIGSHDSIGSRDSIEDSMNANTLVQPVGQCTCGRVEELIEESGDGDESGGERRTRRERETRGKGEGFESHVVNLRDAKGHTALHVACNYRRADVASFLATLPCCDINAVDRVGNTPLHRATHAGLYNMACLLCEMGADVRAANAQLWTPLHEAIRCGSEDVVRTLLSKGCDVNAVTSSVAATTPFLTAIFYYKISLRASDYGKVLDTLLRLLIEAGCKLSEGDYQWTPLSASIDIDKSFIASLLLFNGCRFQRTFSTTHLYSQRNGKTAYTRTNSGGNSSNNSSSSGSDNNNGGHRAYCRSLLVEAFARCEPYVVKLLVLCGYQPSLEEVDQCARRIPSFSPLFYRISRSEHAAMRGKTDLLHWLRQRACTPRTLMELSRTAVRLGLNHATGDTSILKRLPDLPLPTTLRNYVSLSDFADSLMLP